MLVAVGIAGIGVGLIGELGVVLNQAQLTYCRRHENSKNYLFSSVFPMPNSIYLAAV